MRTKVKLVWVKVPPALPWAWSVTPIIAPTNAPLLVPLSVSMMPRDPAPVANTASALKYLKFTPFTRTCAPLRASTKWSSVGVVLPQLAPPSTVVLFTAAVSPSNSQYPSGY